MKKPIKLDPTSLKELRRIDERLVSYNVEMTEVTGGTFWKAYTEAQVDGTEEFPIIRDWLNMSTLMQWYDPVDTKNPLLIKLAKELGSAWVRVSGSWANRTYYDFDGHTNGQIPEGYMNVLTKEQWLNLLDFVKTIDGKLLVSFANCPGNHKAGEPWDPAQAKLLMDTSIEYGVPVSAAEFTNEPNMLSTLGFGPEYTAEVFSRDHDAFGKWLRETGLTVVVVSMEQQKNYILNNMNLGQDSLKRTHILATNPDVRGLLANAGFEGEVASLEDMSPITSMYGGVQSTAAVVRRLG
jgi:hypothetical protein